MLTARHYAHHYCESLRPGVAVLDGDGYDLATFDGDKGKDGTEVASESLDIQGKRKYPLEDSNLWPQV
jgi:hypothetical protein